MNILTLNRDTTTLEKDDEDCYAYPLVWRLTYGNKKYSVYGRDYTNNDPNYWEDMLIRFSPNSFWAQLNDSRNKYILESFGIDKVSKTTVSHFEYEGDIYTWDDIDSIEESIERHTLARF